ncbi:hypothetical protein WJX72_000583 [[Myrmecia] bisecta]|uniref:ORC1/DEAH AAA+ ATPase domain-containing protein n=1 Tax=[Myrmecia] bisecta TaxID=41462 RepID=A0AAW1QEJ4_9CHLO
MAGSSRRSQAGKWLRSHGLLPARKDEGATEPAPAVPLGLPAERSAGHPVPPLPLTALQAKGLDGANTPPPAHQSTDAPPPGGQVEDTARSHTSHQPAQLGSTGRQADPAPPELKAQRAEAIESTAGGGSSVQPLRGQANDKRFELLVEAENEGIPPDDPDGLCRRLATAGKVVLSNIYREVREYADLLPDPGPVAAKIITRVIDLAIVANHNRGSCEELSQRSCATFVLVGKHRALLAEASTGFLQSMRQVLLKICSFLQSFSDANWALRLGEEKALQAEIQKRGGPEAVLSSEADLKQVSAMLPGASQLMLSALNALLTRGAGRVINHEAMQKFWYTFIPNDRVPWENFWQIFPARYTGPDAEDLQSYFADQSARERFQAKVNSDKKDDLQVSVYEVEEACRSSGASSKPFIEVVLALCSTGYTWQRVPAVPLEVIGRNTDVDLGLSNLENHSLVQLIGPPQIGKSTVARRIAEALKASPDFHTAFVDCAASSFGDGPKDVCQLIGGCMFEITSTQDPPGAGSKATDLITALLPRLTAKVKEGHVQGIKHHLVVLDNVDHLPRATDFAVVEQLVSCIWDALADHPNRLLVTSQYKLSLSSAVMHPQPVKGLLAPSLQDAVRLLRLNASDVPLSNKDAEHIAKRICHGIPALLIAFGKSLNEGNAEQVQEVFEQSEQLGWGIAGDPCQSASMQQLAKRVQAVVKGIKDKQQLRVVRSLTLFRGAFSAAMAAHTLQLNMARTNNMLKVLSRRSLVGKDDGSSESWRLCPLLRAFTNRTFWLTVDTGDDPHKLWAGAARTCLELARACGDKRVLLDALSGSGGHLYREGRYAESLRCHLEALRVVQEVEDGTPQWNKLHAQVLVDCAAAEREMHHFNKALLYLNRAQAVLDKLSGDVEELVAHCCINRALVLKEQHKFTAAIELLEKALALRRQVFGEGHTKVATVHYHQAVVWNSSYGEWDHAATAARQALAVQVSIMGDCHPIVAGTLRELALALVMLKPKRPVASSTGTPTATATWFSEAEKLYTIALDIQKACLDPGDMRIATTMMALANMLRITPQTRHRAAALISEAEAVLQKETALGGLKRDSLKAKICLYRAEMDAQQQRLRGALELYQQALTLQQGALLPEEREKHPAIAGIYRRMAEAKERLGQQDEAVALLKYSPTPNKLRIKHELVYAPRELGLMWHLTTVH